MKIQTVVARTSCNDRTGLAVQLEPTYCWWKVASWLFCSFSILDLLKAWKSYTQKTMAERALDHNFTNVMASKKEVCFPCKYHFVLQVFHKNNKNKAKFAIQPAALKLHEGSDCKLFFTFCLLRQTRQTNKIRKKMKHVQDFFKFAIHRV